MKLPQLPVTLSPLNGGRLMAATYALIGLVMTISFVIHSFEVAFDDPIVKLELDTRNPHQFFLLGEINDARRGWNDGYAKGQKAGADPYDASQKAGPLVPKAVFPNRFRLTSETYIRCLEYAEPSPWKRLGLYYLGASDQQLSLLTVLYYALGSWLLLRMLLDTTAAVPFTAANARRLRILALLILGLFLAQQLAYGLIRELIPPFYSLELAQPLSHYVMLNTENELPGLIVFIILSVIAIIYQRGVELHQEAEFTV